MVAHDDPTAIRVPVDPLAALPFGEAEAVLSKARTIRRVETFGSSLAKDDR